MAKLTTSARKKSTIDANANKVISKKSNKKTATKDGLNDRINNYLSNPY